MQRFKSQGQAQKFTSTHSAIYNTFNVQRHLISRNTMRQFRAAARVDHCVRCWANKFGSAIAANIRKRRSRPDSVWHLDEMIVRINGKRMFI